ERIMEILRAVFVILIAIWFLQFQTIEYLKHRLPLLLVVIIVMTSDLCFSVLRRIWVIPRSQDWWHLLINNWTDREFLLNLQMRRGTFQYLCGMLRPLLTRQHTRYRRPLSVEIRVAVCLWRLATNLEYRSISHLFGVGISTCRLITQEVITVINTILKPMYLKTPSPADFKTIIQAFRDKWRFPQVAGAIDGTHIPIKAPRDTPADYYNRKGQYSVILPAVVDHNMKFWDVNIGQNSLLPPWTECFEDGNVSLVILGDAAYPLLPWLMKPFPESRGVTPDQVNFNDCLSQARMVVERAFGRLKGRWRRLLKLQDSHISLVSQVTSACCVLHNFCEDQNEEYCEEDYEEDGGGVNVNEGQKLLQGRHQRAEEIRNALCTYFSRM
uniref:DDE Tnp4 domain-containing protein n=1 Tax=Sphaeramia orbicularis TaxID=375764 RepID=A0A673B144_9TELE